MSREERQFMVMWNTSFRKRRIVADCLLADALCDFATARREELRSSDELRRQFVLQLVNLWEARLVESAVVDRALLILSPSLAGPE